jgi:hypothetical protein
MAQHTIESHREGAEVYTGHDLCMKQSIEVLEELDMPRGLLPLIDLEEVGYNRSTGFVWLKQKNETIHTFKKISRDVKYAKLVTAFVEEKKMKRLTGVKTKELLIWISLTSMAKEDPEGKKLYFNTSTGIGRTFPVSAFELGD